MRAFVTGFMGAIGSAVIAWAESGGKLKLREVAERAVTALAKFSAM